MGNKNQTKASVALCCPICGAPTHVTDTRGINETIRRRRVCNKPSCDTAFTTEERFLSFNLRENGRGETLSEQLIKAQAKEFVDQIP